MDTNGLGKITTSIKKSKSNGTSIYKLQESMNTKPTKRFKES